MKLYTVYVQGWGDNEDEFYPAGTFSSRDKAEDQMEKMLVEWEGNGGDRADVVIEIEEHDLGG